MTRKISGIILGLVICVVFALFWNFRSTPIKFWFADPTTFQECTLARGLILEMYPEQCRYRGKSFTNSDQILQTSNDINLNLNLYTNTRLGILFDNPDGWPVPQQLPGDNYGDGGFRVHNQSLWKLNIGHIDSSLCEGEPCYNYTMEGFPQVEPDIILEKLKNDSLIQLISDQNINGNRVFIYDEGGICGYKKALMFGKKSTVAFTYICGSGEDQSDFNSIIKSLKIN